MRTERTNDNFVSTIGTNSKSFEIAQENQAFIIEALSKNIYKDPIGTIIREYCSNAWDANVEAGVEEPIIVNLKTDATGTFFSVVDFGSGLSEEKINNIFVKYGKSTKGKSNDEIGGFGIGAKSAFSYTDTFFVNTVSEGVMYKYIVSKTNKNPEMSLISKENVSINSGTEIRIYLTNKYDWGTFVSKIEQQLLHFENAVIRIEGQPDKFFKDKKVFNHQLFQIVENSPKFFNYCYALVGPVSYPISFSLINEKPLEISIGIKFDIGELDVTLSREELRYTEETISAIKNKLEMVRESLIIHNKRRSWWCKDFEEFYKNFHLKNKMVFDEIILPTPSIILNKNNFRYKIMGVHPDLVISDDTLNFLKIHGIFSNGKFQKHISPDNYKITYNRIFSNNNLAVILDEKTVSLNKLLWISKENGNSDIIVLKYNKLNYFDYQNMFVGPFKKFKPVLNGNNTHKIMSYKKKVERPILSKIIKLSSIEVPKSFIESLRVIKEKSVALTGVEFNDITRVFGNSFRKIRIENDFLFLDRNTKFPLKDCNIIFTESKDSNLHHNIIKFRNQGFFEKINKSYLDFRGQKKFLYKGTFLIYCDDPKKIQFLKDLPSSCSFDDFVNDLKPTNLMKQYLLNNWIKDNFFHSLGDLLVKLRFIRDFRSEYKSFSYSESESAKAQISLYNSVKSKKFTVDDLNIDLKLLNDFNKKQRVKKYFKEFSILRHDLFYADAENYEKITFEHDALKNIYRKRGLLPSLNCQSPISKWEFELLEEGRRKKEYLQSLL